MKYFQLAISLDPDNGIYLFTYASALKKAGRDYESAKYFELSFQKSEAIKKVADMVRESKNSKMQLSNDSIFREFERLEKKDRAKRKN